MAKDISFSLDPAGAGEAVLQQMSMPVARQAATAMAARARSMAASLSSKPPNITVEAKTGTIKRGVRAIATIKAEGDDKRSNYIGHMALAKAKDAGRVV